MFNIFCRGVWLTLTHDAAINGLCVSKIVFAAVSGKARDAEEIIFGKSNEINEERTGITRESNRWLHASTIDNLLYSQQRDESNTKSILTT